MVLRLTTVLPLLIPVAEADHEAVPRIRTTQKIYKQALVMMVFLRRYSQMGVYVPSKVLSNGVACKRSSVSSPDGNHRSKRRSHDPSSSRDRQREGKLQSDSNAKPVQVVSPRDSLAGGDSSPGLQSAVQSSQALASAQSAPPTPIFLAVPETETTVGGGSAKPEDASSQASSIPYGLF